MIKTFTYDDVVRFIYAETTEDENVQILKALTFDEDLMNFYLDSLEMYRQMNLIMKSPSDLSVEKILNFSYSYPSSEPAGLPA